MSTVNQVEKEKNYKCLVCGSLWKECELVIGAPKVCSDAFVEALVCWLSWLLLEHGRSELDEKTR